MKRLLSILLVLALSLGILGTASALKPVFTQQPETQTTTVGGSVSFSIAARDYTGLTWYFVNPVTLEETTGRNLEKKFPGLKVSGPNKRTITLKKVPAEMNGFAVFCRIAGKGYKIDSDTVQLILEDAVPLMTQAPQAQPPEEEPTEAPEEEPSEEPEEKPEATPKATKEPKATATPKPEAEPEVTPTPIVVQDPTVQTEAEPSVTKFTVTANGVLLYALDRKGKPTGEGQISMTFDDTANVYVQGDGKIEYLMINTLRLTPDSELSGITIRGITGDTMIDARVVKAASEITATTEVTLSPTGEPSTETIESPADTSVKTDEPSEETVESTVGTTETTVGTTSVPSGTLFKVNCEYCRFTGGGYTYVESGEVPMGTVITVTVANGDVTKGYSINGGAPENIGKNHFKYTITGDTTFSMTLRKDALVYGIEIEQVIEGTSEIPQNEGVNEDNPYVGNWELTSVDVNGVTTNPGSMAVTLSLLEDGSGHLLWKGGNNFDEDITWSLNDDGAQLLYSKGDMSMSLDGETDTLRIDFSATTLILSRQE